MIPEPFAAALAATHQIYQDRYLWRIEPTSSPTIHYVGLHSETLQALGFNVYCVPDEGLSPRCLTRPSRQLFTASAHYGSVVFILLARDRDHWQLVPWPLWPPSSRKIRWDEWPGWPVPLLPDHTGPDYARLLGRLHTLLPLP
ncbi:hypothetical protein SAMN00768000_3677 [Sulfobacillus thermosulfidooxidans DSM 9293]|uniref:Uncharacterized protein n=2 Tax=Sulfobacillus thermosulfidooxidans TaxID=28034 RepID=A0A1W1WQ51_SULTA|nr:hypothetical protein [Sulfobacillus thermosulfidooxidans]PSR20421.1 MAG: hypothetical protein C7B47_18040 [Sulfobacillus thermosulfidooxidans]SMC08140.1 hypothetical protein SAMN00768000_3677 [Sulfobacillus thermosulfidooxidans DSM 9293]